MYYRVYFISSLNFSKSSNRPRGDAASFSSTTQLLHYDVSLPREENSTYFFKHGVYKGFKESSNDNKAPNTTHPRKNEHEVETTEKEQHAE